VVLYGILIYEIVRYIIYTSPEYTLSCAFPSENGLISVISVWKDQFMEAKFEINSKASIKVSAPPKFSDERQVIESIIYFLLYISFMNLVASLS
jgi:hypothetical protein